MRVAGRGDIIPVSRACKKGGIHQPKIVSPRQGVQKRGDFSHEGQFCMSVVDLVIQVYGRILPRFCEYYTAVVYIATAE